MSSKIFAKANRRRDITGWMAGEETTQERLRELVREIVAEDYSSQQKAANALGVSQGFLSEFLSKKRGAGPKLFESLSRLYPGRFSAVFGGSTAQPTLGPLELAPRYPNRAKAVTLLVDSGEGTREAVERAADALAVALDSDADPELSWWAGAIGRQLKAARRSLSELGVRELEGDE